MTRRDVIAIDGEAVTLPDNQHLYTLLCAFDNKRTEKYPNGKWREIEAWDRVKYPRGLSTERCLYFLAHLPRGRSTIVCGYYLNYDIAMWVKDLSDTEKTALWKSGAVHWYAAQGDRPRCYYLRWIPSKLFFVGEWTPEMEPLPDMYAWPRAHILIYDVSGFAQRSFVRALEGWDISVDMARIEAMKAKRSTFGVKDRDETTRYCRDECVALSEYVTQLDATFQREGVTLRSWHGGGALASHYMGQNGVAARVSDGPPDVLAASLAAYFGGRAEVQQMGRLQHVYNYDLSSAYPAALCLLPDLQQGRWARVSTYEPGAEYALWHVEWSISDATRRVGPLPFRFESGVYYPASGSGWVHGVELAAAIRHFGSACFRVGGGVVYTPVLGQLRPFAYIQGLAERRVALKAVDAKLALPQKYALNSTYGKTAQHASEEGVTPPYQCYYAAGFCTAWTRAQLLDFTYQGGHDDADIVLFATDGVFCTTPRTWHVAHNKDELGMFSLEGMLDEAYFIQPGCWYSSDGKVRSRGYGAKSLDYERVRAAWEQGGIHGSVTFTERRFVGLGYCAATQDYTEFASWQTRTRTLNFYPDRKFPTGGGALYGGGVVQLLPMDFTGRESEAFTPQRPRDTVYALDALAELRGKWYAEDQPDME
jgi:hypothetical protein